MKTRGLLLAALVICSVFGSVLAAPAIAQTGTTNVANGTVTLTDDTTGLYGQATVDNATDVTVTYYGIENGTETQIGTETLSPAAGATARSEHTLTDAQLANYSEARVVISSTSVDVNTTDYGAILSVSGGGGSSSGGLPMGLSWMQVGGGVLVIGLLAVLMGES
jgi:hypothetical protein